MTDPLLQDYAVNQVGQLKNSLNFPRDMLLFCIVFEKINIPKYLFSKKVKEFHDFYKTGQCCMLF
jgi:hypothetical protein